MYDVDTDTHTYTQRKKTKHHREHWNTIKYGECCWMSEPRLESPEEPGGLRTGNEPNPAQLT